MHQYFGQIGYHITEYQNIRLEFTKMVYNAQQPGGLTDKQFYENPIQSVRDRNWFKVNWNLLALHYNLEIKPDVLVKGGDYKLEDILIQHLYPYSFPSQFYLT